MSHAIAAMVRGLRGGARTGLLFGNGGHCSHNHCIVLAGEPLADVRFPHDYDVQALADAQRGAIPVLTDRLKGDFTVETYTVFYDRNGAPTQGVVLSRAAGGERVIARVGGDDARSIAFLTDGKMEPVGSIGRNRRLGEDLVWSIA